jgi:hypothetical protein
LGACECLGWIKTLETQRWEAFGEDVGILGCHRDIKDLNLAKGDSLLNKMEINLNVLQALMLD